MEIVVLQAWLSYLFLFFPSFLSIMSIMMMLISIFPPATLHFSQSSNHRSSMSLGRLIRLLWSSLYSDHLLTISQGSSGQLISLSLFVHDEWSKHPVMIDNLSIGVSMTSFSWNSVFLTILCVLISFFIIFCFFNYPCQGLSYDQIISRSIFLFLFITNISLIIPVFRCGSALVSSEFLLSLL